jgi:hypothetical protein
MIIKQYRPLTGNNGSVIMPTIRIFSKPTGTNDAINGVAHSIWNYSMTAGQAINYGESIVIYSGQVNKIKLTHTDLRRIVYTNTSGDGDRGNNEIVNHIELIYETAFQHSTLVIEAGMFINQIGLINYYFSNGNASKADIATIAINTKLTAMTYLSNRLQTGSSIVDSTGATTATISTPTTIGPASTIRSLDTRALVGARDVTNDLYDNLTLTTSLNEAPNELYKALDVYARNPSTTNDYSVSGLNVYPIFTKKIYERRS